MTGAWTSLCVRRHVPELHSLRSYDGDSSANVIAENGAWRGTNQADGVARKRIRRCWWRTEFISGCASPPTPSDVPDRTRVARSGAEARRAPEAAHRIGRSRALCRCAT